MRDEKKMERQDARQKKWGDETQDKKNGDMRREAKKKWGYKTGDGKKMGRRDAR